MMCSYQFVTKNATGWFICTLLNSMTQKSAKVGLASLCIGGGEACSIIVEMI